MVDLSKRRIIAILSFIVFAVCATFLIKYFYERKTEHDYIGELQKKVEDKSKGTSENTEKEQKYAENGMLDEYYDLYKRNNDMVGWIKIPDTKINYPVMYKNDSNIEYLHRNFDKAYQYCGLPFLDKDCDLATPGDNLIVYAHNMKDGSMFADLLKYKDEKFCKSHSKIEFDTLYHKSQYEVIGALKTTANSNTEFRYFDMTDSKSKDEFDDYIASVKMLSLYKTEKTAEYGDQLLTLSTCAFDNDDERFVVVAVKCRE